MAKEDENSAAIGPKLCASEYGLNILEENINDSKNNETKFFILAKEINTTQKQKSLILISLPNKSGSLFEILKVLKKQQD